MLDDISRFGLKAHLFYINICFFWLRVGLLEHDGKVRMNLKCIAKIQEEKLQQIQMTQKVGGVKTERVFPGLSVLRKNKKIEVLYPEN
jgi:hypothetical protein